MSPWWPENEPMMTRKWAHDDPKMIPRWSGNDPKIIRKWTHDDPRLTSRWSENDLKITHKSREDDPKMTLSSSPRWPENELKMTRKWSHDDPEMTPSCMMIPKNDPQSQAKSISKYNKLYKKYGENGASLALALPALQNGACNFWNSKQLLKLTQHWRRMKNYEKKVTVATTW